MSEININDLPCEILGTIFRLLDVVDLKTATLACKLWNNVIESECRWSLALVYDNSGDQFIYELMYARSEEQEMNFIMTTNRKFGKISIENGQLSDGNRIRSIFQRHGFNVVSLILRYCDADNLTAVAELLNLTPNLKHVHVSYPTISDSVSHTQLRQPDLRKLKSLDVNDYRIVQCFRKTKLRKMRIHEVDHLVQYVPSLVDFMSSQDKLMSLAVHISNSMSRSILVELGKLNVPFRLTQLAIAGRLDYGDSLLRFVKPQAKNLVELEVTLHSLSFLQQCIIESMPKLNILTVIGSNLPDIDNDFCEGLEANCSVRTIKLLGSKYTDLELQLLDKFFKKLPNVRSVVFGNDHHLNKIAQSLDKIESLAIGLCELSFDCLEFPNLKTLHIKDLRVKIDWNKFTKAHPLLTELVIEKMEERSYFTRDDIDQITTNVDLQHMRLGVGFVADDRFFEIIRTKCTNLKVLDLHKSCLPHGPSDNVGINVLRLSHDVTCSNTFCSMLFEW